MFTWSDRVKRNLTTAIDQALFSKGRPRLSILIFHQVLRTRDFMRPDTPTAEEFEWKMRMLANYLTPMALRDALNCLDNHTLPERAVCVTFDDGYLDNLTVALPILEKWGIPGAVFVSSDFLTRGIMWNDRIIESIRTAQCDEVNLENFELGQFRLDSEVARYTSAQQIIKKVKYLNSNLREEVIGDLEKQCKYSRSRLMLTRDQLVELSNSGIEIGSHTKSHPILKSITNEEAEIEIWESKTHLEELLQKEVRFFAYPNGQPGIDYDNDHVRITKEAGFSAAFSTETGVATLNCDRWQMPRFTPWDKSPIKYLGRMLLSRRY